MRIDQTGTNILVLQPRVALEYGRRIIARRQHPQHMLHGQTATSDNRLAAENTWHDGDPVQKIFLIHDRMRLALDSCRDHTPPV